MANYDFSNLTGNQTGLDDLVRVTNESTSGILVGGLLIAVFLVQALLLSRYRLSPLQAFTLSAWSTFLYSAFFLIAGVLNLMVVLGFLAIAAFGTFALFMQQN